MRFRRSQADLLLERLNPPYIPTRGFLLLCRIECHKPLALDDQTQYNIHRHFTGRPKARKDICTMEIASNVPRVIDAGWGWAGGGGHVVVPRIENADGGDGDVLLIKKIAACFVE